MASSVIPALPPFNKYSLISIWMETALWGMNCIVFAVALFVLLRRHDKPRLLVSTSTILFIFSIIHVSFSLSQLLDAFINVPTDPLNPLYSTLYWINFTNYKSIAKNVIYTTTVLVQDFVLIWRLYVVWSFDWRVVVLPAIVELTHAAIAYYGTISLAIGVPVTAPRLARISPVGWGLELAVNVPVTLGIAGRLWYMGRKVEGITSSYKYLSSIFTIVESGVILMTVTIILLALEVSGNQIALNGIDIAMQLAVLTPLLIIARVGIGMVHGMPKSMSFAYPSTADGGSTAMEMNRVSPKKFNFGSQASSAIVVRKHQETMSDSTANDRDLYSDSKTGDDASLHV